MRAIPGPANIYARPAIEHGAMSTARTAASRVDLNAHRQLAGDSYTGDADAGDDDVDVFATSAPWQLALEALDRTEFDANANECRYNVGWIRRGGWRSGRAPRVVALVRDFGITNDGDGSGTLCDPTGEIRLIVHRELLTPSTTTAIARGCAVLLRDAPVVSVDATTAHALVATRESLVAVFAAEEDADAVEMAKRCKAEREVMRERLRETAAREAMDVEWDDDDAGDDGFGAVDAAADNVVDAKDEDTTHHPSVVHDAAVPSASAFAMHVAALFDD
jgi:hypothetical protein